MAEALSKVGMTAPAVPLVANVLARPTSDPADIRQRLVEQVTGMVRWTESVGWLTTEGGVTHLVELGAGKVLSGLVKRIAPDATTASIGTPADVDAFLAQLSS
jgi:[acyl-carrier-protein] S-malonyltransferase